jgi:hypothetical protein
MLFGAKIRLYCEISKNKMTPANLNSLDIIDSLEIKFSIAGLS